MYLHSKRMEIYINHENLMKIWEKETTENVMN